MQNSALCFGMGYVGRYWARAMEENGFKVIGTSRTPKENILQFDANHPIPKDILHQCEYILITIPPTEEGDIVLQKHRQDFITHPNLKWLGYISGTGVYGDYKGDWVDEMSKTHPTFPQFQNRLRAEDAWMDLYKKTNLPIHIFRCSGIYGPTRTMIERIKKGEGRRINMPGHYISRIHVEDIVQVLQASMEKPNPGSIYNLADDYPCSTREVTEYICDQLGLPYPPLLSLEEADLSQMAKAFYQNNRRVKNDKIKQELGIQLKYPTYRDGYKEILEKYE